MTCQTCKWFKPSQLQWEKGHGKCVRNPPSPQYGNPIVDITDYCGEYTDTNGPFNQLCDELIKKHGGTNDQ